MEPRFFETKAQWRRWLAANHARERELWVGFHKVATGKPSLTWPQSVDEALCFGWIDGVRRSVDATCYVIRFTPRRPASKWSAVNVRRVAELEREGRLAPAGRKAFEGRKQKPADYSYEERHRARFSSAQEQRFRSALPAWAFFQAQAPWYRRTTIFWVVSAKKEATRERRLSALIEASARGKRIGLLERKPGSAERD